MRHSALKSYNFKILQKHFLCYLQLNFFLGRYGRGSSVQIMFWSYFPMQKDAYILCTPFLLALSSCILLLNSQHQSYFLVCLKDVNKLYRSYVSNGDTPHHDILINHIYSMYLWTELQPNSAFYDRSLTCKHPLRFHPDTSCVSLFLKKELTGLLMSSKT